MVGEGFRVRMKNASKIIVTAIALHNYLINTGAGYFEATDEQQANEEAAEGAEGGDGADEPDSTVRDALC